MLGMSFSSKLDWGCYTASITKTASKNIGALILSMKFLSPEVALYLCTAVLCVLMLLAATWICEINYRNGCIGLLVLDLLPLVEPWLIVEV